MFKKIAVAFAFVAFVIAVCLIGVGFQIYEAFNTPYEWPPETISGGEIKDIGLVSVSPKGCAYFIAVERDPENPDIVPTTFFVTTKVSPDIAIAKVGDLIDATTVHYGSKPTVLSPINEPTSKTRPWATKFALRDKSYMTFHGADAYHEWVMHGKGAVIRGTVERMGLYYSTEEEGVYIFSMKVTDRNSETVRYLPFLISASQFAYATFAPRPNYTAVVKLDHFPQPQDELQIPEANYFSEFEL